MAFNRQDLQVAFSVPGTHEFTVWGYGTVDSLEEILQPHYLRDVHRLVSLGDLIYVHTWPWQEPRDGRERGERRSALVMVSGVTRGDASVRLVQDFGRPEGNQAAAGGDTDPAQPSTAARDPVQRRRGRPPGQRAAKAKSPSATLG